MAGWEDAPVVGAGAQPSTPAPAPTPQPAAQWQRAPAVGRQQLSAPPGESEIAKTAPAGGTSEREAVMTAPAASGPGGLLQSQHDAEAAALQGVNPYATSPYFPSSPANKPEMLGHVEEYDWGPGYRRGDAKDSPVLAINPQRDFIARNPDTNRLAVYSRTPQTNESGLTSAARLIVPGLAVGPITNTIRAVPEAATVARAVPHSSAPPPFSVAARAPHGGIGTPVGADLAADRAAEIGRDIEAFDRMGVRKPPVAFSEGPVAGVGKMVSRIPYIGEPINKSLDEALIGARDASQAISSAMAPNASVEQAGHTLQQGLDRFRTAGVNRLEPGVLADLGIGARAPVQPTPFMSRQALGRAGEAAPIREELGGGYAQTNRGVQVPAARPLDQTILARRNAADLSDAELARLIATPSQDTSFAARSEALYEKAWRSVPTFMRINESANPTLLAATNTRATLGQIDRAIANQIAGQGTIDGQLAQRLRNPNASNFTLADLRDIRTEVGRSLSNFSPYAASLDRSQLRGLYGALSRDIEIGLQDIANRAYLRTRVSNNRPDYVAPEIARRADQALRDYRTADRFFRQGIDRMDRFAKVAGTDNPQQAVAILMRAALDGTKGNIGMLRTAMAALRPEERQQFAALVLDQMGKPKPSARGMVASAGFSPNTFMTTWEAMNPAAKRLLFGGEFAQPMDDLVRVVRRLANVDALANTSRSGTDLINFLMLAGGAAAALSHNPVPIAMGGAMAGFSGLMSRPSYVKWIAQYARLRAAALRAPVSATAPRMAVLINQLQRMAVKDPVLLPAYRAVAAEHGVGQGNDQQKPVEQQPRLH